MKINYMEDELGICLFIRSTHGVELTNEGKIVYHEFNKILNQYNSMLSILSSTKDFP